ncbi:MAG: hypothetical protein ACXAC7_03820 [Candidatus Hodarchaeales archaeon]|jgi:hypothetical protein
MARIGTLDEAADTDYQFSSPEDVIFNPFDEHLIVADTKNHCLKIYTQKGVFYHKISDLENPCQLQAGTERSGFFLLDCSQRSITPFTWAYKKLKPTSRSNSIPDHWIKPIAFEHLPENRFFIVDEARHAVFVYKNSWQFHFSIGLPDEPGDSFLHLFNPSGIVCFPSYKLILIADTGNSRLLCFSENGHFISAYTSVKNAGGESFHFDKPTTLGRLSVPGGSNYLFIQEKTQLLITELQWRKSYLKIRIIRTIDYIESARGIKAIPNSDTIIIANTKQQTIEMLVRPIEILRPMSDEIRKSWEGWETIRDEIDELKIEIKTGFLRLGTQFLAISDLISKVDQLNQYQERLEKIIAKVQKLRKIPELPNNLISEINDYFSQCNELITRITQQVEKNNQILKNRINNRLKAETEIADSFEFIESLFEQFSNMLEQLKVISSFNQINELQKEFHELSETFQKYELPKFYTQQWLSHEFQRDLKKLLDLYKQTSNMLDECSGRFKELLIAPEMQAQKYIDIAFKDINPILVEIEEFLIAFEKVETFPSNFIQQHKEIKESIDKTQIIFERWQRTVPEDMKQSIIPFKNQYNLRKDKIDERFQYFYKKWKETIKTDANLLIEVIGDLSRIFGLKIPLSEIVIETDLSIDESFSILKHLISNKILVGHIEVPGSTAKSNSVLILQDETSLSIEVTEKLIIEKKESSGLEDRKTIFKKIILRYTRIELSRLLMLLKMENNTELELWLVNLPKELGISIKDSIIYITELARNKIEEVLVQFEEIESLKTDFLL